MSSPQCSLSRVATQANSRQLAPFHPELPISACMKASIPLQSNTDSFCIWESKALFLFSFPLPILSTPKGESHKASHDCFTGQLAKNTPRALVLLYTIFTCFARHSCRTRLSWWFFPIWYEKTNSLHEWGKLKGQKHKPAPVSGASAN